MSLSRRKLFPLAGIASLAPVSAVSLPEFDDYSYGIRVSIVRKQGRWEVAIPGRGYKWIPGHAVPIEFISLDDFLKELEAEI